ncbi:protein rhiA [Eilatimonas milleporae]|uniref:Protein rhiA n=1 Tax=Eilatimonas milleporae TaxID=911205 RepID=A0A3M0CRU1_9PROT|nr:protein rhiA [Eilatimonas milleporae]RMB12294.1 hypothetical protein BXY39_0787 [Eilatimonas milleporae]
MTMYTLTCKNNSEIEGSFAIFQKAPPITMPGDVFSLAWFARPTTPGSTVTFSWSLDYSFVWAETGVVVPGINFSATQIMPADPNENNYVELTVDSYQATSFANESGSGSVGSLTIRQLANVVPNRTAVGVGFSGSPAYVVQAAPNMTAVFTPYPNYWVLFGNYTSGDVMDVEDITGAVEVTYGGALTSRTATMGLDNRIIVT